MPDLKTSILICTGTGLAAWFAAKKFISSWVKGSQQSIISKLNDPAAAPDHLRYLAETGQADAFSQETRDLLKLLSSVAEEQARKESYVHRGITCNHCNTSPVRGIRYKCANCVDFDICEQCEAEEIHAKTHVFIKIRIPIPPLANPRSALLHPFYPGKHAEMPALSWDDVADVQQKTHFDRLEIMALYDQYCSLSTCDRPGGGIEKKTFEQSLGPLGVERNLIIERIFSFFDQNSDGIIDFAEFTSGLSVLSKGHLDEKISYAFRGYDMDNDGFINREELRKMFKAYFSLSMELVRDVVRALEEEIMESFDDNADKPVSAVFTAPIPSSDSHRNNNNNTNAAADEEKKDNDSLYWPVMESMSQDAIEEMVDRTFASIDRKGSGLISFEEFAEFVKSDSTMIAWFEALGTVF